ncbi:uncharacterized protein LOC118436803 [Folsomia candida]|uniref:uncharacterized protein LOC118436803 n=1 Tax=Folsomia candida TaxID=158441 RepID=UPI001604A979|nr:uncharacterized protein LOC118436803 [Folsomia candida]
MAKWIRMHWAYRSLQMGIILRIWGAVMFGYLAALLAVNIVFAIAVVLVYPTVVKLLILESMNRNLEIETQNTSAYLGTYRTLQILSTMHNSVLSQPLMPALVGGVTVCQSFALCIIIAPTSEVPIPIFLLFSQIALNMFVVIIVPFKMMSGPLVKSMKLLKSLERMNGKSSVKQFVKSCPPSKLNLGDGKFFDKATSLVILSKSVDLLIYFLLI